MYVDFHVVLFQGNSWALERRGVAGFAQCRRVKGDKFRNLRADEVRLEALEVVKFSNNQLFAEREVAPTVRR